MEVLHCSCWSSTLILMLQHYTVPTTAQVHCSYCCTSTLFLLLHKYTVPTAAQVHCSYCSIALFLLQHSYVHTATVHILFLLQQLFLLYLRRVHCSYFSSVSCFLPVQYLRSEPPWRGWFRRRRLRRPTYSTPTSLTQPPQPRRL